jgi:hypothetical protein
MFSRWKPASGIMSYRFKGLLSSICLVIVFAGTAHSAIQATFYASPTGSGSICSEASPGSLTSVRDKVRPLTANMGGDIVILLRGGTYSLTENFVLGTRDGGNSNHRVIYQAYPDEKPVISGGKQITGWTLSDPAKNIYKADVGQLATRQLYINGKRAIRARTPNTDGDEDFGPYYSMIRWDYPTRSARVNGSEFEDWQNPQQVEVVAKNHWKHSRFRINHSSRDGSDAILYAGAPETDWYRWWDEGLFMDPGATYFFENAFEFLDAEGEWYLNTTTSTLYYKPRAGEDMTTAEIVAPVVEKLLDIRGDSPSNPVQNLQFIGITFEYATFLLPNTNGFMDSQGGFKNAGPRTWENDGPDSVDMPGGAYPGAINLNCATRVLLQQCVIRHVGCQGIIFEYWTTANKINFCEIYDASANGIIIDAGETQNGPGGSVNDSVTNCTIHAMGRDYGCGYGLNAIWPAGCVVEHNEIYNCPSTGIGMGWGWLEGPSNLKNNMVRFNNIHHVVQLHDDNGGIYTLSWQPGTTIFENWIHDITRSEWTTDPYVITAIYLDGMTCYVTVKHNVVTNVYTKPGEEQIPFLQPWSVPPQHDNVLENNDTQDQSVKDNAGPKGSIPAWPIPDVPVKTGNKGTKSTKHSFQVTSVRNLLTPESFGGQVELVGATGRRIIDKKGYRSDNPGKGVYFLLTKDSPAASKQVNKILVY